MPALGEDWYAPKGSVTDEEREIGCLCKLDAPGKRLRLDVGEPCSWKLEPNPKPTPALDVSPASLPG